MWFRAYSLITDFLEALATGSGDALATRQCQLFVYESGATLWGAYVWNVQGCC